MCAVLVSMFVAEEVDDEIGISVSGPSLLVVTAGDATALVFDLELALKVVVTVVGLAGTLVLALRVGLGANKVLPDATGLAVVRLVFLDVVLEATDDMDMEGERPL